VTSPSSKESDEDNGELVQQNDLTIFGADATMLGETFRGSNRGSSSSSNKPRSRTA
ncbi:hypothetical protein Pmar_PMAR008177, partial [Perkinsus marinus ATCC 50983]